MKAPQYLSHASPDDLARMVEGLVEELWVTRDRLLVLEELLVEKGVLGPDDVDDHLPSDSLQVRLQRERIRLVKRVLGAPEVD